MASVTVNLTGFNGTNADRIFWAGSFPLGATFSANNTDQALSIARFYVTGARAGEVNLNISGD